MTNSLNSNGSIWEIVALTERGRVRGNNEDGFLLDGDTTIFGSVTHRMMRSLGRHIFAVADGMGGHAKGEVASALAINQLKRYWEQSPNNFEIVEVLRRINREIYVETLNRPDLIGMGTTLAGISVREQTATWFNVGDSRVYLYRHGELSQLTKDDVLSGLSNNGKRRSHAITQSLGGARSAAEIWPSIGSVGLQPQDVLLLCTDGVTDTLTDGEVRAVLAESGSIQTSLKLFSETIEARGAQDNYTIVLANLRLD